MRKLLYLVHRLPYPPNKGDKIRSFNFLKMLAEHYQLYVGCFIDDPDDRQYLPALRPYCQELFSVDLQPATAKVFSLRNLLTGDALSLGYFRHPQMQTWVTQTLASHHIRQALIFSSPMAQYLQVQPDVAVVADLVDVDSDKWRQYAERSSWPLRWLYRREADKLLEYERRIAGEAAATLFVSSAEAGWFAGRFPQCSTKIDFVNNGVDSAFFDPAIHQPLLYPAGRPVVVFTGVMDYWPNVDAVCWFVEQVLPLIKRRWPRVMFYIVGSKPAARVKQLAERDAAVVVTGRVADVRPYLAHAALVVAPLRIARGVQNKVLEALAMAKPVVATSSAIEGIEITSGQAFAIADQAEAFAERVLDVLERPAGLAENNRRLVVERYDWQLSGEKLRAILARVGG